MIGSFTRGCGAVLCAAALITLGLNLFVTPLLPKGDFTQIAASNAYLIRQCLAALVAMLLVFGAIGIHISRLGRTGLFGAIAAVLAITGSVCLFEIEYSQLAAFHTIALIAPAPLTQVMAAKGNSLQFGTFLAVIAFFGGWFLLALSLLASQYSKLAPVLIMIGLLLPMLLGALGLATPWPAIASSLFTGGGWFLIGLQMIQLRGQGAS